jgi:hypothetical protein
MIEIPWAEHALAMGFLNALRMVLLYGGNVFTRSMGFAVVQ